MYGVVSLLDEQHDALVEELWAELESRFEMRGIRIMPYPHFSYHVAERYDSELLENVLRDFASRYEPFTVATSGIGIFAGIQPVLYVPIVRSQALSDFHRALWNEVNSFGTGIVSYYHPDQWLPHVTLAQHDLTAENLPTVVRFLSQRDFFWQVTIDNIALIHNTDDPHVSAMRFPLGQG